MRGDGCRCRLEKNTSRGDGSGGWTKGREAGREGGGVRNSERDCWWGQGGEESTLTAENGVNESQGASAKAGVTFASLGEFVWLNVKRGLRCMCITASSGRAVRVREEDVGGGGGMRGTGVWAALTERLRGECNWKTILRESREPEPPGCMLNGQGNRFGGGGGGGGGKAKAKLLEGERSCGQASHAAAECSDTARICSQNCGAEGKMRGRRGVGVLLWPLVPSM